MCRHDGSKGIVKFFKIAGFTLMGICAACAFALLFGLAVKALWNWIMPAVFGLGVITYWQAVGLFILAKIFFGSCGKSHPHHGPDGHPPFLHKFKGFREWHDKCHGRNRHAHYYQEQEKYQEFWEKEGRAAFEEYLSREQEK